MCKNLNSLQIKLINKTYKCEMSSSDVDNNRTCVALKLDSSIFKKVTDPMIINAKKTVSKDILQSFD